MSDKCKYCRLRGNIEECQKADCEIVNSWVFQHLIKISAENFAKWLDKKVPEIVIVEENTKDYAISRCNYTAVEALDKFIAEMKKA